MQGESPEGSAGGSRGSHRGKGPKGYTRSDERLKEIISERLMDDPEIDASEITVNVTGQRVTLDGTVESRLVKYQVEELIESCGVDDVVNNLRIQRPGQTGQQSSGDTDVTGGRTGARTRGRT
jgi:osmotically-inducible protein OsmY